MNLRDAVCDVLGSHGLLRELAAIVADFNAVCEVCRVKSGLLFSDVQTCEGCGKLWHLCFVLCSRYCVDIFCAKYGYGVLNVTHKIRHNISYIKRIFIVDFIDNICCNYHSLYYTLRAQYDAVSNGNYDFGHNSGPEFKQKIISLRAARTKYAAPEHLNSDFASH